MCCPQVYDPCPDEREWKQWLSGAELGTPSTCNREGCWPHPLQASQQWCLAFQTDPAFSRVIPRCTSPHPHLPSTVSTQPTAFLSPVLVFQPYALALWHCHLRRALRQGVPGLIPKEVSGWAVLRPLEPTQLEATLPRGVGGPTQVATPPNAHRGQRSRRVGKGVIMVVLPFPHHSTMTPCYGVSDFPGCGSPCSYPFRLSFHSQKLSSPGSALQTPLSGVQLPLVMGDTRFRLECIKLRCRSWVWFLLCPASTDCLLHSSLIPWISFSVPADFPLNEGVFLNVEISPHLELPSRVAGLFLIPLFVYSFFFFLSFF